MDDIVCVFDQALYAKAAEIVWKNEEMNQKIVLKMGVFHTICNLLSVIGKRYGSAGLRDIAVEAGVIAEGSINSVLDGRNYNRGVRLCKLMYEALMRLAWNDFKEQHLGDQNLLNDSEAAIQPLIDDPCQKNTDAILVIIDENVERAF